MSDGGRMHHYCRRLLTAFERLEADRLVASGARTLITSCLTSIAIKTPLKGSNRAAVHMLLLLQ